MKTQAPQLKYPIFLPLITKATNNCIKNLFAITLSIVLFTGLSAQKADLDKDTITVDGKAYAVLKKTICGLETPEFSLQTTNGTLVAEATINGVGDRSVNIVTFKDNNRQHYYSKQSNGRRRDCYVFDS